MWRNKLSDKCSHESVSKYPELSNVRARRDLEVIVECLHLSADETWSRNGEGTLCEGRTAETNWHPCWNPDLLLRFRAHVIAMHLAMSNLTLCAGNIIPAIHHLEFHQCIHLHQAGCSSAHARHFTWKCIVSFSPHCSPLRENIIFLPFTGKEVWASLLKSLHPVNDTAWGGHGFKGLCAY